VKKRIKTVCCIWEEKSLIKMNGTVSTGKPGRGDGGQKSFKLNKCNCLTNGNVLGNLYRREHLELDWGEFWWYMHMAILGSSSLGIKGEGE
jgi:hypothetical protein